MLGTRLGGHSTTMVKSAAAEALTRLRLSHAQLTGLTALFPELPPGALAKLLPLFEAAPDEALLAALENSYHLAE